MKAIFCLEGMCLLSFSHTLSFKSRSGKGSGNFKFSFFQTSLGAKQATQGWRRHFVFATGKVSGWCSDGSWLFQMWREGCDHGEHEEPGEHEENNSSLTWLAYPYPNLPPTAATSATPFTYSNHSNRLFLFFFKLTKTFIFFLILFATIQQPTDFSPHFPKLSSVYLWGLPSLKVTYWWYHFPGRWLCCAPAWRCPDVPEPHEPIIYLAGRDPSSASLLDVANQLHY